MRRNKEQERQTPRAGKTNPFQFQETKAAAREADPEVHVFGDGIVCDTDTRGHATPKGRPPQEIVVDASEGFIPLWAKNTTLRWRFRDRSLRVFANPSAAKTQIRRLFGDALLAWGDATPVKFSERSDAWDFEIVMRKADDCDINGCVLASAFFPDGGRHELTLYPKMFSQSRKEQVETMVHEIGHIFGLRHFFADVSESAWPSHVFGEHKPFSIMNYGNKSVLTADDKADLKRLYQSAWSGELTNINGTPIRFMTPFHTIGALAESVVAIGQVQPTVQPVARALYATAT
jgi:hypothetical protein